MTRLNICLALGITKEQWDAIWEGYSDPKPWWGEAVRLLEDAAKDAECKAGWPDRKLEYGPGLLAKAASYRRAASALCAVGPSL